MTRLRFTVQLFNDPAHPAQAASGSLEYTFPVRDEDLQATAKDICSGLEQSFKLILKETARANVCAAPKAKAAHGA